MKRMFYAFVLLTAFCSFAALGQGKFSGYMFGDYYYNIARDGNFNSFSSTTASNGAAPGTTAMQAFQLRRIYFAYDNDISEQFTTRFRLEADQAALPGSTGSVLTNGKISVFVKDAYLKWKGVFSGSDLIFGVQPTPAYDVSEGAWGYRSLEKTIMDLRGIVDSRDMGVSLKGKLTDDGMVNYWVMLGNGAGTSKPEGDRFKRYYAHIQVKPMPNLQATAYADYKDVPDIANGFAPGKHLDNHALTTALFVGYTEPSQYNVGVEAFLQSTNNGIKDTVARSYDTKSTLGFTIYGSYNFMPELALVLRYDNYNPSTDDKGKDPLYVTAATASGNLSRNYIIAGLDWKVDKRVSVIPNLLYETYEAPKGGTAPDASVTARVTFYYVFL
jgi:hypothetical protein